MLGTGAGKRFFNSDHMDHFLSNRHVETHMHITSEQDTTTICKERCTYTHITEYSQWGGI